MTAIDDIFSKLGAWEWDAAVLGLGYVGLPLVVSMARSGIGVTGFDVDAEVTRRLASGRSHVGDVGDEELAELADRIRFTSDIAEAGHRDVLFVCVPTPLAVGKQPDMSYIERAARLISGVLRPGHVVILESTTYPGTTENVMRSILEESGLRLDDDFLLAYAPERIDPGNASFRTANIPRIVGGASPHSTEAGAQVYRRFVEKVHTVSTARAAEMAKLLENTFRWVNIALVNELSSVARAIDVNIWEVIDAAATKPFGYMPFYPGPGVGGHCIPLDPFYLAWAARVSGEGTRFIELAEWVNSRMPLVVLGRVQEALNERSKAVRGARVLAVGVAFKPNVADVRESPALEVVRHLLRAGAEVSYVDPIIPEVAVDERSLPRVEATPEEIARADCVLILCDHDAIDYAAIAEYAPLVVDTRNALARRGISSANVSLL